MIQLRREIKILTLFLAMTYGIFAKTQAQPQANGTVSPTQTTTNTLPAVPGQDPSITNSTMQQTAPSDITTVNPMDPTNDSRRATDSEMLDGRRRRAMSPTASGTVVPGDTPQGF